MLDPVAVATGASSNNDCLLTALIGKDDEDPRGSTVHLIIVRCGRRSNGRDPSPAHVTSSAMWPAITGPATHRGNRTRTGALATGPVPTIMARAPGP